MSTNISRYTNPRYVDSNPSSFLSVGTLSVPENFMRVGTVLSWSAVENAERYYLYDNDVLVSDNIIATTYQLSTQSVGSHSYKLKAVNLNDGQMSALTSAITFTVAQLSAPVIAFNEVEPPEEDLSGLTSELYFNAVTDAEYYDVYVDSNLLTTLTSNPTTSNPYVITKDVQGAYQVTVVARNSNTFLYKTSAMSNSLTYTVIKAATSTNLTRTAISGGYRISWTNTDTNITEFKVYVNGVLADTVYPQYYDLLIPAGQSGSWSVYVVGINTIQVTHSNPRVLDSNPSATLEFGTLASPVISITNNIVSWTAIQNAAYYMVYNNGSPIMSVEGTSYEIYASTASSFSIQVQAVSTTTGLDSSTLSNTVTYNVYKLSKPSITLNNGTQLVITPVPNADYYQVYINETVRYPRVTNAQLDITLYAGYNNIYAVAMSDSINYLASDKSNSIVFNKEPDTTTVIKVYDKVAGDYVDYPLIYPFSFNETIDETMDVARCITAAITLKDPFEAFSNASIYIYNGKTPVYGFPKHMLISEDDVEEIQTGEGQLYKHNITLIERTKELETVLLPDFSITQSQAYSEWDSQTDRDKRSVEADIGTCKFVENTDGLVIDNQYKSTAEWYKASNIWEAINHITGGTVTDWYTLLAYVGVAAAGLIGQAMFWDWMCNGGTRYITTVSGFHTNNITSNMMAAYDKAGQSWIDLPVETGDSFVTTVHKDKTTNLEQSKWYNYLVMLMGLGVSHMRNWFVSEPDYYVSSINNDAQIVKKYYYRQHTTSYDKDASYPETEITPTYVDGLPRFDISALPNGYYDIIMEIEPVNPAILAPTVKCSYDGDYLQYSNTSLTSFNFMLNNSATKTYFDASTNRNPSPQSSSDFKKYRVVWGNKLLTGIQVADSTGSNTQPSYQATTVADAIDRALQLMQPLSYKSGKLDSTTYTLDPNIRSIAKDITCPELTFSGTKSLYEVLQTFGRLFYGIPRLGIVGETNPTKTITYDIINFGRLTNTNSEFADTNVKEEIKSTIDNHATGYVSNLSNVITTNYWTVYPSGDVWTTARADSEVGSTVEVGSMAIVVDKPIYKLKKVYVRNYSLANPYAEPVDITSYINEDAIYRTLNNNATGKGLSLVYKQNDNRIRGVGQLPEEKELFATLGWSADKYVIDCILEAATGLSAGWGTVGRQLTSYHDYQYKVEYIPVNDVKVYTEQANVAGLANNNYKVLNQDDNTINDDNFGKSAQTQVERLGNNNIEKLYRLSASTSIPSLGQIKVYDGFKYYADAITISYYNNYIDAQVSYSKNFNKINERVGINSMYRLYEIENKNIVQRQLNINNYCYISTQQYSNVPYRSLMNTNYRIVQDIKRSYNAGSGNGIPNVKPDMFYIRNLKDGSPKTRLTYVDYEGNTQLVPACVIPATYNTFKTNITFSGKFYDNFACGEKADDTALGLNWIERVIDSAFQSIEPGIHPYQDKQYYKQKDVRYCDSYGTNSILGITLCNATANEIGTGNSARSWPEAKFIEQPNSLTGSIHSEQYLTNKDNRECLNLIYQLHFLTYDKNIYIHSGITNRIYRSKNIQNDTDISNGSCYYCFYKGDYNKSEKLINNTSEKVTPTITQTGNVIKFAGETGHVSTGDYDGFALVWSDGTIIYTYNMKLTRNQVFNIPDIYFNFTDEKVDYKLQ